MNHVIFWNSGMQVLDSDYFFYRRHHYECLGAWLATHFIPRLPAHAAPDYKELLY